MTAADLRPFPWRHTHGATMTESESDDVVVVVYREDATWDVDLLPHALTEDLAGLIQVLGEGVGQQIHIPGRVFPVHDDEDIDQVLPAGDLSIFADLGLDEMELAAICSRLDVDSDDDPWDHVEDAVESIADRLGFGPAMERALDVALGS